MAKPAFCRVWGEIGAASWSWETRSVLMVPLQRPTLVMVRNAKGYRVKAGPGLHVKTVDKDSVRTTVDKYLAGIGVTGAHLKELTGALFKTIVAELAADGVLLSVDAKSAGKSWLKAGDVKQTVSVTRPLVSDVTFEFLHHLDDKENMKSATGKVPGDVDGWIADLNWILGAQANVWFEVEKAVPLKIETVLGRPVNDVAFKNYILKEKDGAADATVFLVGKWEGTGDAGGTFYPDDNVIALDDSPAIPVIDGGDPFIITLAHELVHYVLHYRGHKRVGHLSDQYALLNTRTEATYVTPQLQDLLSTSGDGT
jgi:hypothetical protein